MDKVILGSIATAIAVVSYIPYLKDIYLGKTKPHAFSWLIWLILTAISFFAQVSDQAGPGAWVTGVTAVICIAIILAGITKGRSNIVRSDWLSLGGALIALALWPLTHSPFWSVILVVVIDALGWIPNFRKSYHKPYEETLSTYVLSGLKYVIAFFALENISVATTLYPAYLTGVNAAFVSMLVWRRKHSER